MIGTNRCGVSTSAKIQLEKDLMNKIDEKKQESAEKTMQIGGFINKLVFFNDCIK